MFLDDESLSSLECVIYSTICVDIEQDGFLALGGLGGACVDYLR